MKNYQQIISSITISIAVIIASLILAQAIEYAGATIGSQIAQALNILN